ncbi:uncharacterized protein LOC114277494 [Camellia sinensis]|uniref:uncharacterized protein LOC114277494 n=1 Tax=Camellia sinensis TaxID=4442 RepID=UPI001036DB65|nr:uncharacterized protein LOC114277494 [Camellia sinensis]
MCDLKSEKGYIYYHKPRSAEYKLVADLSDSNKGAGDDYFIVSGRTRSRRRRSAESSAYDPANPPTALLVIHFGTRVTIAATVDETDRKPAVVKDLLTNLPGIVNVQPLSSPQLTPKPKRVKKAKAKATVTQIDSEDTVPISKLAETEKSAPSTEKRPAENPSSEAPPAKKPRSDHQESSSYPRGMVWAPEIMLDDRPLTAGDSAANLEHSVLAIQHAHSYATKTEMMRKDLAKDAKTAQSLAEEKAKEAKNEAEAARADLEAANVKVADMEAKLQEALANKEAKVKAADEKAFEEGQVAVRDQYKQQLEVPFPPEPEEDAEDDEADEVEEEVAANAKSPTLNDQIDLTQDEEDDLASKVVSPKPTISEAEVQCIEKSLDKTLEEIDAELEADKSVKTLADEANPNT